MRLPPRPTRFPYTTLFRSVGGGALTVAERALGQREPAIGLRLLGIEQVGGRELGLGMDEVAGAVGRDAARELGRRLLRSEEHTSELQSRFDLVCRLLLEQK